MSAFEMSARARWTVETLRADADRAPAAPVPTFLEDFDDMPRMSADQDWLFVENNEPEALRRRSVSHLFVNRTAPALKGAALRDDIERRANEARRSSPVEQARRFLQRRGIVVYRASVDGGCDDCWVISGHGRENADADLIAIAVAKGHRS